MLDHFYVHYRRLQILICCLFFILTFGHFVLAQGSFEIEIAGYKFDPKATVEIVPTEFQMSETEKAAYQDSTNYYLVQLKATITADLAKRLKAQYGLRLQEYVPELAYLERLDPETRKKLVDDKAVRVIVVFEPQFKISPHIGSTKFRTDKHKSLLSTGLLLNAVLFKDAKVEEVKESIMALGGTELKVNDQREYGSTVRVSFVLPKEQNIREIAKLPEIRWIEEVSEYDEDNGNTAGTMQSGTPGVTPIWDIGIHGEGQTISVMEGRSVDPNHCMFNDPTNPIGNAHRKIQQTFANPGGHATFVSGIAVGDDINNLGTGANRGNAWAARLVNVVALTNSMFTQLNNSAGTGAFIHTNSWHGNNVNGANQAIYDQISVDVDTFIWNNENHVVLGSMGNNGEEQGPPGTAKNAIGINAGTTFPNTMGVGDGNPGPTAGGRRKPDVVTPGCNIQSARLGTACTINQRGNCATSWATPAAAAASALIRQYYVDGYYPGGISDPPSSFIPSGALVKASLVNSTIDMTGIAGYPSNMEGWGLVRLDNALFFQGDDHLLRVWDTRNSNGLTTGGSRSHVFDVADNDLPLTVTLVWTDAPATAGATNPAINNLNLRVVSPDGTQTFRGNVFSGGVSVTGGTADTINNVEQVMINLPATGQWTIIVDAVSVNVGNPAQGYALVATAGRANLEPQINIPGNVNFGDVCVGNASSETFNVCNSGNADLIISSITSSDPVFSTTTPSGGYPVNISPGDCFPFQGNFSPTVDGSQSAQFNVQSNDPVNPVSQVQTLGNGTVPDIKVSGSTDFGTVSAWSSGEKTIQVCNIGSCPLTVNSATINCPDFTVLATPFPTVIGPVACTGLTVTFTPTVPGPHSCVVSVSSDDPDSPVVDKTLTARTPPAFSIHTGLGTARGGLDNTNDDGLTLNLDYIYDITANWAWDVRLGITKLDGKALNPDVDIWNVSGNARYTFNPLSPVRLFVNGGLGLYHFDPGSLEGGGNLGAGIKIPINSRFSLEATYNYHTALTASPNLRYDQIQLGLLISF